MPTKPRRVAEKPLRSRSNALRVAILVEDHYEDLELQYPRLRLLEHGIEVVVAGPGRGRYSGKHGYPQKEDVTFEALSAKALAGIVIPGGWAPDRLRRSRVVLDLVAEIDRRGALVASICHGPWVPVSAGIVRGRRMTSVGAIRDDVVNAGAIWSDEAVVVDGNLVSSRTPDDLPDFCRAMLRVLDERAAR